MNEAKQKSHCDLKSMKCHYLLKITHCAMRLERRVWQQHWYHMRLLRLWPQTDVYSDRLFQLPQRLWGGAMKSWLPWGALLPKQSCCGSRCVSSEASHCQNNSWSAGSSGIGVLKEAWKTLRGQGATKPWLSSRIVYHCLQNAVKKSWTVEEFCLQDVSQAIAATNSTTWNPCT